MPEIGAAQVEAALEQLFHVPFVLVDTEAGHPCAECGADRRTRLVEPYGDFVGQQAGCRVQGVPARRRVGSAGLRWPAWRSVRRAPRSTVRGS